MTRVVVVEPDKAWRRGRQSKSILMTYRRASLIAISLGASSLFMIFGASALGWGNQQRAVTKIIDGQSLTMQNFARQRGYIRYRIAGTGKRSWLYSIATRFHYCGDWREIAEATRQSSQNAQSQVAAEDIQFKVEVGMDIRIPLRKCK